MLNKGLSKIGPALAVGMKTATEDKPEGLSVEQWCEILVEKASRRMEAADELANCQWEN